MQLSSTVLSRKVSVWDVQCFRKPLTSGPLQIQRCCSIQTGRDWDGPGLDKHWTVRCEYRLLVRSSRTPASHSSSTLTTPRNKTDTTSTLYHIWFLISVWGQDPTCWPVICLHQGCVLSLILYTHPKCLPQPYALNAYTHCMKPNLLVKWAHSQYDINTVCPSILSIHHASAYTVSQGLKY